jgi:hypothetical protein
VKKLLISILLLGGLIHPLLAHAGAALPGFKRFVLHSN